MFIVPQALKPHQNQMNLSFSALVQFEPQGAAFKNIYLLICVDVLVEPLECINIEFHQLSQKVKVTLKHIS